MSLNLQGRRIIVTGAGRGIGRDIAEKLDEVGAVVFAISRTKKYLDELKAKCPNINIFSVDLDNLDEARKIVESIGSVDGVVNNAAILMHSSLLEATVDDYEKIWKTNISAVLNVSQAVAKGMIASGKGGSIVNISSNVVNCGSDTLSMYASSKAALDRLTKSMALEWGPHGIRVNCVSPSMTETDMIAGFSDNKPAYDAFISRTPLGRLLRVDDVTGPVLFMLSDLSKMITGEKLCIDGGYNCS